MLNYRHPAQKDEPAPTSRRGLGGVAPLYDARQILGYESAKCRDAAAIGCFSGILADTL